MLGALSLTRKGSISCDACERDAKIKNRPKGSLSLKEMRGCHGPPANKEFWWPDKFGGQPLERCPQALLNDVDWWPSFVDAYSFYKEKIFPIDGGFYDQSGVLMSGFRYFDWKLEQCRKSSSKSN